MPSLLLVEDDAAIRTALQLALTRQGHQVATVVARKCGAVGPAPQADSPLAATAAEAYREAATAWAGVQPADALAHRASQVDRVAGPAHDVEVVAGDAVVEERRTGRGR